jgi:uncharacterized membrane protein
MIDADSTACLILVTFLAGLDIAQNLPGLHSNRNDTWKVYVLILVYALIVGFIGVIFSTGIENLSNDIRNQPTPNRGIYLAIFFWGFINQKFVTKSTTSGDKANLEIGIATFYNFLKKYVLTLINQTYIHKKMEPYLSDENDIDSIRKACEIRVVWDLLRNSDTERAKNRTYVNNTYKEAYKTDENGNKVKSELYSMSLEYLKKFAFIGSSD